MLIHSLEFRMQGTNCVKYGICKEVYQINLKWFNKKGNHI